MALEAAGVERVALLCTLLSSLLWPGPHGRPRQGALQARPRLQGSQGLQGGWAVDDEGNTDFPRSVLATLPLMQRAGAGWVRINFRLGDCYPDWTSPGCDGRTALAAYDQVVDAAGRRGLSVLGLISNESWRGEQADWLGGNAEVASGNGDNPFLRAFSAHAAVPLASHFCGRIGLWEVWNEPNAFTAHDGAGHYWGGTFIYPSNLAWLLRHVYEDTRLAGVDGARFISGGLLGHDGSSLPLAGLLGSVVPAAWPAARADAGLACDPSGAAYLRATYACGRRLAGWDEMMATYGSYPLDGIGQHLYLDQGGPTDGARVAGYLQAVRDAYLACEPAGTAKLTYVTEFGWQTQAVSPALQADNLRVAYDTFQATPYVAQAYWYAVQDIPAAAGYYGLAREDGTCKPAFAAYQASAAYPPTPRWGFAPSVAQ